MITIVFGTCWHKKGYKMLPDPGPVGKPEVEGGFCVDPPAAGVPARYIQSKGREHSLLDR